MLEAFMLWRVNFAFTFLPELHRRCMWALFQYGIPIE